MRHFTINELTHSDTAVRRNIDNTPPYEAVENLRALVDNVLDPAREAMGCPIIINSGYRSEELNAAVGGVSTSQHRKGEAADITTGRFSGNIQLYRYIRDNLVYDQLIEYYHYQFIHVSYRRDGNNRKQAFSKI